MAAKSSKRLDVEHELESQPQPQNAGFLVSPKVSCKVLPAPAKRSEDRKPSAKTLKQQSIQQQMRKTKASLRHLFLNYCEFNKETGAIFVSQIQCIRLFKDAKIVSEDSRLQTNGLSILIQTVLKQKINMIKAISFQQFLDCIFALSELKEPKLFRANPKAALQKLISENFYPLLSRIEAAAFQSLTQKSKKPVQKNQNYTYSKYYTAQRQIVFNSDTQAIFSDIMPLMRTVYSAYFDMEVSSSKGHIKRSDQDLLERSYKSCMAFCKDFSLMPYMLSQRACTIVWHTIAFMTVDDPEMSRKAQAQELSNNVEQTAVVAKTLDMGRVFTFSHFVIFFYRVAILAFDSTVAATDKKQRKFNLVKKLLRIMDHIEKSDNLLSFMKRIGRTYTKALTFLPSKELLAQILVCEGLDRYIGAKTIEQVSKEDLIKRILDGDSYVEFEVMTSRVQTLSKKEELLKENDAGTVLEPFEDQLKQLFHVYCAFGDPLNTKYLKSSRLLKMLRECGLVSCQSSLKPGMRQRGARQVSLVDIDLLFKTVCKQVSNSQLAYDNVHAVV